MKSESSTCLACDLTSSTSLLALHPSTGEWDPSISHLSRVEGPDSTSATSRDASSDFYPHISWAAHRCRWMEHHSGDGVMRETLPYTGSQTPDLTGTNGGIPSVSHDPLNRNDLEASADVRPPAIERDYSLAHWNRQLRHVIEPEFTYKFVGGIGANARKISMVDTSDIATNTNEVGFSLTQRLYLRSTRPHPCNPKSMRKSSFPAIAPRHPANGPVGR